MSITFKKLTPDHARKYREIRLESLKKFPDSFGSSYEEESKTAKLNFEVSIENPSPGKFIIGAFDGKKLIGICGFVQEDQKKTRHKGSIVQMYVKPEYKGKKLGFNLLKATIEEAAKLQEIEQITLGVEANNIGANKIYEESGFREYGFAKGHLKAGSNYFDQRLMILYLDRSRH